MASFSVIVVNYRGDAVLERCVASIARSAGPPLLKEIIVVDNASGDAVIEGIASASPLVRVLRLPENIGYGAGANRGAEQATGSHVVVLNNDAEVPAGWLEAFAAVFKERGDESIVCPTVVANSAPDLVQAAGTYLSWLGTTGALWKGRPLGEVPPEADVPAPTGACVATALSNFRRLGGFDESLFMYCEDVELGWRARQAGCPVRSLGTVRVLHRTAGERQESEAYFVFNLRNRLLVIRKRGTGFAGVALLATATATALATALALGLSRRARLGKVVSAVASGLTKPIEPPPQRGGRPSAMPLMGLRELAPHALAQLKTHAQRPSA